MHIRLDGVIRLLLGRFLMLLFVAGMSGWLLSSCGHSFQATAGKSPRSATPPASQPPAQGFAATTTTLPPPPSSSSTTSSTVPPSTTADTRRQVLPPATVPPKVDECTQQLGYGQDGDAAPIKCANGDLNVLAWEYYAKNSPLLMTLGPYADPAQQKSALCSDASRTSTPISTDIYDLSALYYGWHGGIDPTADLLSGGCSGGSSSNSGSSTPSTTTGSSSTGVGGYFNGSFFSGTTSRVDVDTQSVPCPTALTIAQLYLGDDPGPGTTINVQGWTCSTSSEQPEAACTSTGGTFYVNAQN